MAIFFIIVIGLLIYIAINLERNTTNTHTLNRLLSDILKVLEKKEQ
jgi:hypothetical protein